MKQTDIQWAHSTINPVMGCDGCELWPGRGKVVSDLAAAIKKEVGTINGAPTVAMIRKIVSQMVGKRQNSIIYADRNDTANKLANCFQLNKTARIALVDVIRSNLKCYAGLLGTMRADHKGYASQFEEQQAIYVTSSGDRCWQQANFGRWPQIRINAMVNFEEIVRKSSGFLKHARREREEGDQANEFLQPVTLDSHSGRISTRVHAANQ